MSVPNQTPYIIYNANGLTTVFPFEFYIINAGDIQVSINGTTVTSGYSVSGTGNVGGGDVTFITPPASGSVVMLERVVPTYRLTDYQDNGDLLADTVNKDFDRLWMAIQRSFIYLGLALRRPLLGGPYNAEGYRISQTADPVDDQDVVTKKFAKEILTAGLRRTLRVPGTDIPELPSLESLEGKIIGFSGGKPVGVMPESGSASDVFLKLAAEDGAKLSLSQVATAYGLDFSLGGVWFEGGESSKDNWWWYNNKVYTGGSGILPSHPSKPWYPIRHGSKLNLTDFIIAAGATDIEDVVDWQWAIDAAEINIRRGYSGIVEMDGREYSLDSSGYIIPKNVGFAGAKDAMMSSDLDGVTVLYINKPVSSNDVFFHLRGGNELSHFGVFFAQQTYGTPDNLITTSLSEMLDVGVLFKKSPQQPSDNTKGCILHAVSVCGGSKIWQGLDVDSASGEYDVVSRVSTTPTRFGPSFTFGQSTDLLRVKSIHVNANVVSMYRSRYQIEIQVRGLPSKFSNAIAFKIERMDGATFTDILTYGVPFAVVFGEVGPAGGTNPTSANFSGCTFDATCFPVYVNCPNGAFGIQFCNVSAVFTPSFGDSAGALVYLGGVANEHQIQLVNVKTQLSLGFSLRPVRAVSGSTNNRVSFVNAALTSASDILDEGMGNRVHGVGITRNLTLTNCQTNLTPGISLLSAMGELNTIVKHQVSINIPAGATFSNTNINYPYTGWISSPNVITEVVSVAITGQPDATLFDVRTYARSLTSCVLRTSLSSAAASAGVITVDLYIIGTVRGVLAQS
ncbi:phage tail fiber protein [Enterobacter hormaechei]|uniref:phage tail fiber domain-containing protein n=1 Tax=Enterobacter hormaechei TaxID=158836 RepID=UPI0005EE663D|nr:phage tail fiber protein [Enterobacter hormaechei]KJO99697.1 hypothetical protein SS02_20095 [Enterobacter hormaechei subsp. steigerwaltii]